MTVPALPFGPACLSHTHALPGWYWRCHCLAAALGTHLCWLHEVSHVPQPIPQLLDLGHRNSFEFGDNGNLGVQVPLLVAFLGKEGPPGEEIMGSVVCPQHMVVSGRAGPPSSLSSSYPISFHTGQALSTLISHQKHRSCIREPVPSWESPTGTMELEVPTTTSFTSQHSPPPLARPSFLLKDSPDPARTGGLYRGPYCSSSHKRQELRPTPPRATLGRGGGHSA